MTTNFFKNSSVKELSGSDFDDTKPYLLKDKQCTFILFYAPWCGHCQNIKLDYRNFGDMCQFIKVAALNTDVEKKFIEKLNSYNKKVKIVAFPTIWIYKDGKPLKQYDNERNLANFCAEAMKICKASCGCDKK